MARLKYPRFTPAQEQKITQAIHKLKTTGDDESLQLLWDLWAEPVKRLAEQLIGIRKPALVDADDVVIQVFWELYRGATTGRWEKLETVEDLRRLLQHITENKVRDQLHSVLYCKRGGGRPRGESDIDHAMDHMPAQEEALFAQEAY
jgi:hypothetical protein